MTTASGCLEEMGAAAEHNMVIVTPLGSFIHDVDPVTGRGRVLFSLNLANLLRVAVLGLGGLLTLRSFHRARPQPGT